MPTTAQILNFVLANNVEQIVFAAAAGGYTEAEVMFALRIKELQLLEKLATKPVK